MAYGVITPETMNLTAAARNLSIHTTTTGSYRLSANGTDKLSISASLSASADAMAMNAPKANGLDVTIVYN